MGIPAELSDLYKGLSPKESLYLKMRWAVSPVSLVERAVPIRGRIYDIGCGVGLLSNLMALNSGERQVTGIDLSDEKIAIARRSISGRSNIKFETSDIMASGLDHPDAVVACDLLHHIEYTGQERLIRKIYDSLGKGAVLIVQDIDKAVVHKYIFAFAVDMLFNKLRKVFYRTSGDWVRCLERSGFQVEARRIDKGYPIPAILFECRKNS